MDSQPLVKGENVIPDDLYGLSYDEARKKLLAVGWIPNSHHWSHGDDPEVQSGNGSIFWKRNYWELDSCAGTGLGQCRFEFSDPSQRTLVVITEGEEIPEDSLHASVGNVFIATEK